MKYVALLRGINVGGKTMIKMADLRTLFEEIGFTDVLTYINSGNIIFASNKNHTVVQKEIEEALAKSLHYEGRIVLLSAIQFETILNNVPEEWTHKNQLRCYISFLTTSVTMNEVLEVIELREGIDTIKEGKHVLYMSTQLSGLTKSGFTKLIGKKIFQEMTIRNYNTSQKIGALLKSN